MDKLELLRVVDELSARLIDNIENEDSSILGLIRDTVEPLSIYSQEHFVGCSIEDVFEWDYIEEYINTNYSPTDIFGDGIYDDYIYYENVNEESLFNWYTEEHVMEEVRDTVIESTFWEENLETIENDVGLHISEQTLIDWAEANGYVKEDDSEGKQDSD